MPILFNQETRVFTLATKNTQYNLQIICDLFPVHLYYGEKTDNEIALH